MLFFGGSSGATVAGKDWYASVHIKKPTRAASMDECSLQKFLYSMRLAKNLKEQMDPIASGSKFGCLRRLDSILIKLSYRARHPRFCLTFSTHGCNSTDQGEFHRNRPMG